MKIEDTQKEWLAGNVEQDELKDFTKEVEEEKKAADKFDLDKVIENKLEQAVYKAMAKFEAKPVKSIVVSVASLFVIKWILDKLKK